MKSGVLIFPKSSLNQTIQPKGIIECDSVSRIKQIATLINYEKLLGVQNDSSLLYEMQKKCGGKKSQNGRFEE